jgi:hypothetical protein
MFWFIDDVPIDLDNIDFGQIFPYYNKYEDISESKINNSVYQFANMNKNPTTNNSLILETELDKYKKYELDFEIKIKGNYISYLNLSTRKLFTFKKSEEFINEIDNELKLPLFLHDYTIISDNKMPNLHVKDYDFYFQKINFIIYKINDDTLFVIENNNTNNIKKYIINKNVDVLGNILV